jgi:hypothetical protein
MGQPPGLGAGPDDEGPERQAPGPFQPDLIAAPVSAGEQLQQQGEHPGGPIQAPRERGMGPVARHHQEDNADAGRAEGAAEFLGRREVLGRVQAEGLERGQPQQGGDDDGERFPGGIGRLSWRR